MGVRPEEGDSSHFDFLNAAVSISKRTDVPPAYLRVVGGAGYTSRIMYTDGENCRAVIS